MNSWQIIVVLSAFVGIIVWVLLINRYRKHWGYGIAPISYFAHLLIFYLFVYVDKLDPIFLNGWSNALRLHGIILFIGIGISILVCGRKIKWISR